MSILRREKREGVFLSPNQLVPFRQPMYTAGVPVTYVTAIQAVALHAAANLVASLAGLLPLHTFTGSGGDTRQVTSPKVLLDPEGETYGFGDFGYQVLLSLILGGNAYIQVMATDAMGLPSLVRVLSVTNVTVTRDGNGRVTFSTENGKSVGRFPQDSRGVIHLRAFTQTGRVQGLSVVANHARTIGLNLATEQFGSDFFASGAMPTGILSSDQPINQGDARTIKDRWMAAVGGTREPAVVGGGIKYQQVQIAPEESQFLQAQQFTAAQCCRMVGPGIAEVLGYETGGSMTYQNVVDRDAQLLKYAADQWLVKLEKLLTDVFLPKPRYARFDRDAFLRMNTADRWASYTAQMKSGARPINEIRADEDLAPVEWGDTPYLPSFGPTAAAAEINDVPGAVPATQGVTP